jgi:hypothetical protein
MTRLLRSIVTLLVILVAIGGWSVAGVVLVRTATPGQVEDSQLVSRVTEYIQARVDAERNGFSVAPVAAYLSGSALEDAKALELTDATRAIENLRLSGDPEVVVLMRSGTTALVQAVIATEDSFGAQRIGEQYLLKLDSDGGWKIDAVFRLAEGDLPPTSPAN